MGELKEYVIKTGLAFYGLAEIKDPLMRANQVGRLLKKHVFLFPNPDVRPLILLY